MLDAGTPRTVTEETAALAFRTDSVALARLVAEVQDVGAEQLFPAAAYNRTYHRHNR